MEDQNKDQKKAPKNISRRKFLLVIFATFFFRTFIFLLVPGIILLVLGIFRKEFLLVGAALLAVDLILSLFGVIKTARMEGSYQMFKAIVQAASEEAANEDPDSPSGKPDKEDLYSEKAHELRREASEAKTVREVFELYKKDIAEMALGDETYTVYVRKEKYFFDEKMHCVISFDRMREINDDLEHHMYMDILFEPDRFGGSVEKTFESNAEGDKEEFFEQVREHLESNGLMDLAVEDINVGASY